MKRIIYIAMMTLLLSFELIAAEPVTLSGPVPPLSATYRDNSSDTVIYTITNYVPQTLPLSVSGISGSVSRTTVAGDCGNEIQAGPSTCNIGISISPTTAQVGSTVNQVLTINYQGRTTLQSPISFSVVASLFAYATPSPGSNSIFQLLVDVVDGLITSVDTAYSDVSENYGQLVFATVGGIQYAYTVDATHGVVYQCTIGDNGTLNTCSETPQTPVGGGWMPYGIAFTTVGSTQYAYVTDVNSGRTYQCPVVVGGVSNGALSSCSSVTGSPGLNAPYGIAFATVGANQYVYLANAGPGTGYSGNVTKCTVNNSDGSFNSCGLTPSSGAPSWIPYGVAFTTANGIQYAYVADNGSDLLTGHIYRCTLSVDGSFDSCLPTPTTSPSYHWVPSYLTFATLNGTQYAYVANYQGSAGSMYRCVVEIDGTFSSCILTPDPQPTGWTPVGVAFR